MSLTAFDKGKGKALPEDNVTLREDEDDETSQSSSSSDSESDSDASSSEESDSEDEITPEFLESLLEKARQNALASTSKPSSIVTFGDDEDVIQLEKDGDRDAPLPPLDPGLLPTPYIDLGSTKGTRPVKVRDLDVEHVEKASSSATPTAPAPPPSARPLDKPLTKKQRKELRKQTAGPSWFDLPAPEEAERPRLYREIEALRLRNQLDPKRFYRKDEGEGKGIKGLPKYFAIGTIVSEKAPFNTASSDNLTKAQRKRTLVDELVDDAEAKSYAKKKFKELQSVRGARGRSTLAQRQAKRKPKW